MQRRYVSWMLTMSLLGVHGHEARAQDAAAPIPSAALATALETRNTMTLRQRALEKWAAGDADPALGLLAEAIARIPYDASNYMARSRILSELKRYDAAIADLRRATELEPALSNAWGNLGWHLILQGDFAA
ncbi:hypothetical protein HW932_21540, partial [Allochromatium humboldtianum]